MRRFAKFAAANMERDRHSRRLQSACPRRGARVFRSVRRQKARPRQEPAKAPNTRMRRARASERPDASRAFHVLYRRPSSVNHAARRRAQRCRNKHEAPPRVAPPRPAQRRLGRPQKPKARRSAPRQPKRQPGPERVAGDSLAPKIILQLAQWREEHGHRKAKSSGPASRGSLRTHKGITSATSSWLALKR